VAVGLALVLVMGTPAQAHQPYGRHPAQAADGFVDSIGINTHLFYTDTVYGQYTTLIKPLLGQIGVRHIRDGSPPNRQVDYYPRLQDLTSTYGIHVTTISGSPSNGETPAQTEAVVKQIGAPVEMVEGSNEYDSSGDPNWPTTLKLYQQQLYAAVKGDAATSALPVVGPSMVLYSGGPIPPSTIGDLSPWSDYGNVHPYNLWPPGPPGGNIDAELAIHSQNFPGRVMLATETGYPTQGDGRHVSEAVQAKYVPRVYLEYYLRNIGRTFDYEFIDEWPAASIPPWSSPTEASFGLIHNDGTPKASYTALKNLIGLLSDPGPAFNTECLVYNIWDRTADVHELLLQKRDGTFYLVLWLELPSTDATTAQRVTVGFAHAVDSVSVYLPNQSPSTTAIYTDVKRVSLSVPDSPVVLQISPGVHDAGSNGPGGSRCSGGD
jgi:hypothetical protein